MAIRRIAILGATGSIGRAALRVVGRHPDRFRVSALTAHSNAAELDRLAMKVRPDFVVLSGELPDGFEPEWGGDWRLGPEAVAAAAGSEGADVVLNALVGIAGLEATIRALETGKRLALANKESLVAGGRLVLDALESGGGEMVPVDSEHSAVHQCLNGSDSRTVRRLILTASGGPFRTVAVDAFAQIGPDDALAHPTWNMGSKITIDSATLANKALEVIEAHYLFALPFDRIDVVVHPSSIVHSMVELLDGSVLAQLGQPTMELPILWALGCPERIEDPAPSFDPVTAGPLVFEDLRRDDFPMFGLGVEAGRQGGELPVAYNAANEVVVEAFLAGRLGFPDLATVVEETLGEFSGTSVRDLDAVWRVDSEARELASRGVERIDRRNLPAVNG